MPEVTPFDDAQTALDKLHGNYTIETVMSAMSTILGRERGNFVVGLFDEGAPADVLRPAIEFAWDHDYTVLWNACGARRSVFRKLLRAAKFDKSHLPKSLDIWRGGVIPPGGDWHDVAVGISWTRNRDAACWFAIRYWGTRFDGEPVVLKRAIERRDVLAHITSRGDEDEIVTTTTRRTVVDGSIEEWRAAADRYQEPLGVRNLSAAAVSSRASFLFGRFEVMLQATNVPGLVTGFFLHRDSPRQEIDVEIAGNCPDRLLVNVFYNPGSEGAKFDYGYRGTPVSIPLGFDASKALHRFAIEWDPCEIRWFVDDELVHRRATWDPTPIPHLPMTLHVNTWPTRSRALAGRLALRALPASAIVRRIAVDAFNADTQSPLAFAS